MSPNRKLLGSTAYDDLNNSVGMFNSDQSNEDTKDTNVKPDMPYLLNTTVIDGELDKSLGKLFVELSWRSAVDDNTDLEGLSYAIKMGTSSGTEDVVSSNSSVNGVRKGSGKGNAEHNTKWKIALAPGTYYWSVQSVDNAQTGSEFSFEDVFTVTQDNLMYDLGDSNGDDTVNIADIINIVDYMLGVDLSRFIDYASDVNNDNSVNVLDLMGIVDIILNPNSQKSTSSTSGVAVNSFGKKAIRSIDDIEYRSSDPVGDVFFYWDNETLYMQSDHKIGGLQLAVNNESDIVFDNEIATLNNIKIQREKGYEIVYYSMNATELDDNIAVLSFYGDKETFDLSSLVVSTIAGEKLNINFKTLSNDKIIGGDNFVITGVYPNPVTNGVLSIEYFTPSPLTNQEISIFDIVGREVYKESIMDASYGLQRITIDLKNIPNGILFLEFTAESSDSRSIKHISKFIKQ